jgi:hypothetical protein
MRLSRVKPMNDDIHLYRLSMGQLVRGNPSCLDPTFMQPAAAP